MLLGCWDVELGLCATLHSPFRGGGGGGGGGRERERETELRWIEGGGGGEGERRDRQFSLSPASHDPPIQVGGPVSWELVQSVNVQVSAVWLAGGEKIPP